MWLIGLVGRAISPYTSYKFYKSYKPQSFNNE
jgi:hypothetical protein